uniref:DNA-directed RNA polymerase RBP11-like dimerisation domain-containing protein n=1 Tax=Timema shepardi TaxID=629360 RepID=A0A7R9AQ23_TIMSH|nr:unnamed protein product [Timema shepardi]
MAIQCKRDYEIGGHWNEVCEEHVSCHEEKQVIWKRLAGDEKSEKSRTFVFSEGGHTVGNALRSIVSRYPEVLFCGYTVPHPAEANMHFRIQTSGVRAVDVLRRGIEDLEKLCDHTINSFQHGLCAFSAVQEHRTTRDTTLAH